jgi:hypothetical protein
MPILTVFSALYNNSRMFGISCLYPLPRQSLLGSPGLPLALYLVLLQMEVYYYLYINCLLFPKLQHSLILFNNLVDDKTFYLDLMALLSFIAAGSLS